MTQQMRLRLMTSDDIPFADSLRTIAGWNQTQKDWQRFLDHEPEGCFIAESDGTPAGTATTTSYGTDVAWIGMVLVHPDSRRHGIGRALLERCLEYLQQRGVRCIKLDATPTGKKLYDTLGFLDEWTLTRWETGGLPAKEVSPISQAQIWRNIDTNLVEGLDGRIFGVSRQSMLALLAKQSLHARLHVSQLAGVDGYGLIRPGAKANYLGPIVATTPAAGLTLAKALINHLPNQPIIWDIPDQNADAVELAKQLGFSQQRQLIRMHLGENLRPGIPWQQFAIGAPEIG
jgi:GNAT superfamily N-acetyltransferase